MTCVEKAVKFGLTGKYPGIATSLSLLAMTVSSRAGRPWAAGAELAMTGWGLGAGIFIQGGSAAAGKWQLAIA
jgi:hypothetical protein